MLASTRGLIVIDLALLTFVACAPAFAQDTSPVRAISPQARERRTSYGGEIAFGSGHADRGFIVSDRPVVQPVLWLSGSGAELSVWGNFTLGETTDGSRPQIVEVELTREHKWRHVTIGPAIRMFVYHDPLGRSSTRSVAGWLYLSYDAGPLRLFTNHSVDVLTYRGAYFGEAGIESERRVLPSIAVGGSFAAGWASSRFNEAYRPGPCAVLQGPRGSPRPRRPGDAGRAPGHPSGSATCAERAVRNDPHMTSSSPPSLLNLELQPGKPPLLRVEASGGGDAARWAAEHRDALRGAVTEHGALLVRGLGLSDVAGTEAAFRQLGSVMTETEAFAPRRRYAEGVYSASKWPPNQPMCMHHELSYALEVPSLMLFACLVAPTGGGATPVADAATVLDALPAELVERFERLGWLLIRNYNDDIGASFADAFGNDDRRAVDSYYRAIAITFQCRDGGALRTWT